MLFQSFIKKILIRFLDAGEKRLALTRGDARRLERPWSPGGKNTIQDDPDAPAARLRDRLGCKRTCPEPQYDA